MKVRQRHGCVGQAQEYYEYAVQSPKFVAQKCGPYWIVGITYPDGVWRVSDQTYPTATAARAEAYRLMKDWYKLDTQMTATPGRTARLPGY
jgi:hypothetical protein